MMCSNGLRTLSLLSIVFISFTSLNTFAEDCGVTGSVVTPTVEQGQPMIFRLTSTTVFKGSLLVQPKAGPGSLLNANIDLGAGESQDIQVVTYSDATGAVTSPPKKATRVNSTYFGTVSGASVRCEYAVPGSVDLVQASGQVVIPPVSAQPSP